MPAPRVLLAVFATALLLLPLPTGAEGIARYAICIHGGAGGWRGMTRERTAEVEGSLKAALGAGCDVLAGGGHSLDAVEAAIRVLEDAPCFNAGKGATFNAEGRHQLDSSIMRGRDREAGAVAAITVAKHPISAARAVMEDTRHVLLAGAGADHFANENGLEVVGPDYFWTEGTRREWESYQRRNASAPRRVHHYGTVGCVALDTHGEVAAGTSTGGLEGKRVGRVGDSPLIAAGTYADNRGAAVSGTGVGELFIRNAVAYDISARVRYAGATLEEAVAAQIQALPEGTAGVIALTIDGRPVAGFNTRAMPRGFADQTGRFEVAIEKD